MFIYSSKGGKRHLGISAGVLFSKAKFLWYSCEEPIPEYQVGALLCSLQLLLFGEGKKKQE